MMLNTLLLSFTLHKKLSRALFASFDSRDWAGCFGTIRPTQA